MPGNDLLKDSALPLFGRAGESNLFTELCDEQVRDEHPFFVNLRGRFQYYRLFFNCDGEGEGEGEGARLQISNRNDREKNNL